MATNPKDIVGRALSEARKAGASDAEAFLQLTSELNVRVRDGKPESLKQASRKGLGLRVLVEQKPALVYTSDFRSDALTTLAAKAVTLAKYGKPDPSNALPHGPSTAAEELDLYDPAVAGLASEQAIARGIDAEKAARGFDPRIKNTQGVGFGSVAGETWVASTQGIESHYRSTQATLFASALAEDAHNQQRAGNYASSQRFLAKVESAEQVGREAGRRAAQMVGAKKIATTKMPVLMHGDVAADWLNNMFSAFSGEQVFKQASYLSDKLGQTIGSPLVTLVDDGRMKGGVATSPFDAEGVPTRRMVLLDKGVVKGFVYNTRWALKAGAASTGNAARGYSSAPGIGQHNLYLENGDTSVADLIKGIDRGFYLLDTGAFGYEPTTGGWSYQSSGLWIEKGAVAYPVTEVTLASDTLTMLEGVTKVGNDLVFNGGTNSPHLLIAEMTLSGT